MVDMWKPFREQCAIAGIGATEFSKNSGRSDLTLASEAALEAIADAGLSPGDIDGIVRCDMDRVRHNALAGALGIDGLTYFSDVGLGGGAPCGMVGQAVAAILSGQARHVLVYRSLNGRSESRFGSAIGSEAAGGLGSYDEFYTPFGLMTAPQLFALLAQRHSIQYGTRDEHRAAIALTCRENANQTPHAQMHDKPLSLDDYLNSRMISSPLRLFDCCLETDGACALVVTSAERARDMPNRPALIRAVAQGVAKGVKGGMMFPVLTFDDPLRLSPGHVAKVLWERAGLGPEDMDVAQIYDCFTISVLLQLEDYGFCKRGESGPFAASGAIRRDGSIPINTAGGNMSEGYIHGLNHIVEGVRQMRGSASAQIDGAETCLVTSGPIPTSSALVLRRG